MATAKGTYFSISEFACKDGTEYPQEFVTAGRWDRLQSTLNLIRERWGSPIRVVSGYRSETYNRHIGGAKKSQHVQGTAADLRPMSGTAGALHAVILGMHRAGELPFLGGLGIYPTFVHADVRRDSAKRMLAQWRGGRADDSGVA
jgi:hypothetical protein